MSGSHAECPISFQPLHTGPVGVFVDESGRRLSKLYYNLFAAKQWLAHGLGSEPITGQPAAGVVEVPDPVKDLRGWFEVADVDGDGELTREEVVQALRALLPLELDKLDDAIADDTLWARLRDQPSTFKSHIQKVVHSF